jgi:hypothetical protein
MQAHFDNAPGAPVSDPAVLETTENRAESETGVPKCR